MDRDLEASIMFKNAPTLQQLHYAGLSEAGFSVRPVTSSDTSMCHSCTFCLLVRGCSLLSVCVQVRSATHVFSTCLMRHSSVC
jgi:hypothetical protein